MRKITGKVLEDPDSDLSSAGLEAPVPEDSLHSRFMRSSFWALPRSARRVGPKLASNAATDVRVRSLAIGCTLLAVCGCQELRVRISEWAAPPSAHASSNIVEVSAPERFLVLNVSGEDSHWSLERSLGASERSGVAERGRSPVAASGQLAVNPEDLSRIRGVVSGPDVEYRLRKVSVTGPSTLAGLAPSGTRTALAASGELTYRNVSRPAEVTLFVEADIAEGQLNSLRIVMASPVDLTDQPGVQQVGAPPAATSSSAAMASALPSTAGVAARASDVLAVSFDLVARPSPAAATGVR